jgi:hypothetical protein
MPSGQAWVALGFEPAAEVAAFVFEAGANLLFVWGTTVALGLLPFSRRFTLFWTNFLTLTLRFFVFFPRASLMLVEAMLTKLSRLLLSAI